MDQQQPTGVPLIQPTAPDLGPAAGRSQVQPAVLQPTVQARQLFVVQPPAVPVAAQPVRPLAPAGFAPAAQPPLDPGFEDRQARRRVVSISLVLAVYVVLGTFTQYYLDMAAVQDAMEQIRTVAKIPGGHVDFFSLMLSTSPQVGWSIALGLLVPLCGYLGVKQNNAGLMGCFASCNALHCCCGALSMVTVGFLIFATSAAAPGVLEFLDRCDPVQCAPQGLNKTDNARVVDCLAASTWETYEPRFPEGVRLSPECPKIFLDCDTAESRREGTASGDFLAPEGIDVTSGSRRMSVFRKPLMPTADSSFGRQQGAFGRRHEWHPEPPPQPKDPIADCVQAESVEVFHKARLLAPELLPKVLLFLTVKLILTIPFIVLGCLGFCWGKEMWCRLGQGYAHLSAPGPVVSEVQMQPVMGMPLGPTVADAHLAVAPQAQLAHHAGSPTNTDQE